MSFLLASVWVLPAMGVAVLCPSVEPAVALDQHLIKSLCGQFAGSTWATQGSRPVPGDPLFPRGHGG